MLTQMDGITSRSRNVNGIPTSLKDLGYSDVGLDDFWQQCGRYVRHESGTRREALLVPYVYAIPSAAMVPTTTRTDLVSLWLLLTDLVSCILHRHGPLQVPQR